MSQGVREEVRKEKGVGREGVREKGEGSLEGGSEGEREMNRREKHTQQSRRNL